MPLMWIRIAIAGVIAVFVAGVVWKFRHDSIELGRAEVRAEWTADIAKRTAQALAASEAARQREKDLQANSDRLRKDKDGKILSLNVAVSELNRRLRDRPERPASPANSAVAGTGGDAKGCTGGELYRPDGEFLVLEAARADTIRIGLQRCEAAYQAARDSVILK